MADDTVPSATYSAEAITNSSATTETGSYEICQRSGFKVPAGTLVKEWTGIWVHPRFWEARHPQDFARPVPEQQKGSVSPEPANEFYTYRGGYSLAFSTGFTRILGWYT